MTVTETKSQILAVAEDRDENMLLDNALTQGMQQIMNNTSLDEGNKKVSEISDEV